ncbi:MAG: hypothetical protein DYG92_03180 [Leptolyngbya sp. PLA1]|nr:hypothetical protein [Leptolyngbya sp. PLA1]
MPAPAPQIAPWTIQDPPPLPPSPLMERLTLESPAPLIACLGVVALAFWLASREPARRKGRVVAGILLLVALGVGVLSSLVETTPERLGRHSREVVAAVAAGDADALARRLDPEVVLLTFEREGAEPLEAILRRVATEFAKGGRLELKDYGVLEVQAVGETPRRGRVQIKVRATLASGVPGVSWWRLDYHRGDDGEWRVSGIQPLAISGVPFAPGR